MRRRARLSPDSASVSMRERLTPTSANSAATKKPLRKTSRTTVNRYSAVSIPAFYNGPGVAPKREGPGGGSDLLFLAPGGEQLLELAEAAEHLLLEVVGLVVEVGDLHLGLDVDVVLDVGAHLVLLGLPVGADEHEGGEEDGLEA